MTTKEKEVVELIAKKAAQQNLTVEELSFILELCQDLEDHSEGTIQALGFRRTDSGCVLSLFSLNAKYAIALIKQSQYSVVEVGDDTLRRSKRAKSSHKKRAGHPHTVAQPGKTVLRCFRESFGGCGMELIAEGQAEDVATWEDVRQRVLWLEGWETWMVGEQKVRVEKVEEKAVV
jgi:hypothetical protein